MNTGLINSLLILANIAQAGTCQDLHQKVGYSSRYSQKLCSEYSDRRNKAETLEVSQCVEFLQFDIARLELDPSIAVVCLQLEKKEVTPIISNLECVKRYDQVLARKFWLFEDMAIVMNQTQKKDSLFKNMSDFCATSSREIHSQKLPRLLSRTVFHTLTSTGDYPFNLGGLSGLTMDSNQNIFAVSDNRQNPHIVSFKFASKYKNRTGLEIVPQGTFDLNGPYTDLEDIAIDRDGDFIVTSEEIPGRTYKSDNETGDRPKGYVFKMNPDGQFKADIRVPDEFYSQTLELDALCGKKEDSGFISFFKELFTGSKRKKMENLSSSDRSRCDDYNQAEGIRYNKGIESLSIDSKKTTLYFIPEQPLMKKNGIEKTVPLVVHNLQNQSNTLFHYPLDLDNESGIVGLLKVSRQSLLVLERGFDQNLNEATVTLYKTQIPATDSLAKSKEAFSSELIKTKLFTFKDFIHSQPLGLHKVDNFEGLALGPISPNGNPTLLFVSDNNLSLKQKTDFILLEVPKSWLE